ncbi:MAG TPA: NTP transferase domain-containing protein [Gaiellaceae bacterium]
MRIVGVVPAAGLATRLQPLETAKELLDVGGRPVIDYLLERLRAAAADEIRVVTRPDKLDVAEHARRAGATVILGTPDSPAESFALGLAGLDEDDIVLLGFPDTIWEPVDGFATLLEALGKDDAALGLFRTPDLTRSDVVVVDGDRVTRIAVKPARPPSDLIWGCAAVRRRALAGLAEQREAGVLLDALAKLGRVRGVHLSDSWLDIGTPEALAAARASA